MGKLQQCFDAWLFARCCRLALFQACGGLGKIWIERFGIGITIEFEKIGIIFTKR